MRNIIINLQNSDAWKIQLTIAINFISSKDAKEERVIHSAIHALYSDASEIIDELFKSLRSKYQVDFGTSIRRSDFIFDSVQLMYYTCHIINFIRGGSCIDSPDWIKKKKAAINPKNTDDKCFQYSATVALNYEEIESHPERVSNIKPFINKCNSKGIYYPSKIDGWKTFEKNNPTIALNILHIKEKEICPAYISKISSNYEEQTILLMIRNEEKEVWRYLAVTKLSTLLRGISSKHHGDFYCLNGLNSFRKDSKLKPHEKSCKNNYFCRIVMPSENDNTLEFNQYMKSDKMLYIIYADTESLIKLNRWMCK